MKSRTKDNTSFFHLSLKKREPPNLLAWFKKASSKTKVKYIKVILLSFFFRASTPPLLLHIFSLLLNCTTTIISLEPCALNAEYRHFILRFIKNVFTLQMPLKEGMEGERRPKNRVKTWLLY